MYERASPIINDGDMVLFANDTELFLTNSTKLQSSLDLVHSWLQNRQLNLAAKKCVVLPITKNQKSPEPEFLSTRICFPQSQLSEI